MIIGVASRLMSEFPSKEENALNLLVSEDIENWFQTSEVLEIKKYIMLTILLFAATVNLNHSA